MSADAEAGEVIFDVMGCASCHSGGALTDSTFLAPADPLLHDVGTITEASGERLGGPLLGLDTPTLHELWNTPPYLHDGSAATLLDVLTTKNPDDLHGSTSGLSAAELDQLVAYLLSLE
jgi:cytochrome c peroxidase